MGELTCTQFITHLTLELGQRTDITAYDDTWLNAGYRYVTSRRDLRFPELDWTPADLINTTDGTPYVDTTSAMLYVQGVYDTANNVRLRKITPKQYFSYTNRSDATAEGKPTQWTHVAGGSNRGYIYLHPTPDTAYTLIRYFRALPAALTGSATTVIGAEWDEVILRAAVWLSWLKLMDYEKAKQQKTILDGLINDLKGLYDLENLDLDEGATPHIAYRTQ